MWPPFSLLCSSDMKELYCMNNYFGIGFDAKIAYEFHTRREENPGQFKLVKKTKYSNNDTNANVDNGNIFDRNRTKNKILYGYLGGREFFTNTQKNLERKLKLEVCDTYYIYIVHTLLCVCMNHCCMFIVCLV